MFLVFIPKINAELLFFFLTFLIAYFFFYFFIDLYGKDLFGE